MAITHGVSGYNHSGCRCDICETAMTRYRRARMDGFYEAGICHLCQKAPRQGVYRTCERCRAEFRAYHTAWRQNRQKMLRTG